MNVNKQRLQMEKIENEQYYNNRCKHYRMKNNQLNEIQNMDEFLVKYEDRSCTDVCCSITGIIYSVVLFIFAIALFNYDHFFRANFPSDSDGRLCGIDQKLKMYPYLYFVNPPDMSRRVCVSSCPMHNDQQIKCIPTESIGCHYNNRTGYEVIKYENYQRKTRSGFFCYPENDQLRNQLLSNSNLQDRDKFFNSIDTIQLCFFVSFGFGLLYLLAVQFVKKINLIVVVLGWLTILACLVCIITYHTSIFGVRLAQTILLGVVLVFVACWLWRNHEDLQIYDIFLRRAANMIRSKPVVLAYIPIFILILYAFLVIVVLEFTSFWSSGFLVFDHTIEVFYQLQGGGPIFLTVLLAIQLIWGLSFIKLAFNFLVSTQAVFWLYNTNIGFIYPFKLMICKHFGSVVAGAFMIGFFTVADFIFDTIAPSKHEINQGASGCKGFLYSIYEKTCGKIVSFFDLVRSDAMAYISLTGNPYCNSSRYCQYLCDKSNITNADSNQSISRIFRVMAHILLAGIMVIFGLYVKGDISVNALFIIFLLGIFTSTFFVSLHGDSSEALQILYLADQQFTHNRKTVGRAHMGEPAEIQDPYGNELSIIKNSINAYKAEKELRKGKIPTK